MAALATAGSSLSAIKETTLGTTPGSPAFKEINSTSDSLQGTKTTETSNTIRADRQKDDLVVTLNEVGGDISMQLDVDNHKDYLQNMMLTDAADVANSPADQSSLTVAYAHATKRLTLAGASASIITSIMDKLKPGMKFKISGHTTAGLNTVHTVKSINATNDTIDIVDAVGSADISAAGTPVFAFNNHINGAVSPVLHAYTFMKQYNFPSKLYHFFRGCVLNTFSFSLDPNALVEATMGVVGRSDELTDTAITSQSLVAAPTENLLSTGETIDVSAPELGSGNPYSFSLSLDNQVNLARALGTFDAVGQAAFTLNVTGSLSIYFEDKEAFDQFDDEDAFPITVKLEGESEDCYIYLPSCKITSLSLPRGGQDQFLFVEMDWEALRDATAGYTMLVSYV